MGTRGRSPGASAPTTRGSTLHPFTPNVAAALDGPQWLRRRREQAAARVAAAPMPTTEEEVWRYSRINDLELDTFQPSSEVTWSEQASAAAGLFAVTVVDGRVVAVAEDLPAGVEVLTGRTADEQPAGLGAVITEAPDLFGEMNDAFAPDPLVIRVPAGTTVEQPIEVLQLVTADGAAVFPRVVVDVGGDSQVTVIEHYRSDDVRALVVPVVEIAASRAARVSYGCVQQLGPRVWQIASQVSRVDQDATFTSATAALGGDYARLRTDCRLSGRGATGNLLAAYFGEGGQMLDFRTFQDHRAPDTTSALLFKGAVGGASRSVYTGLIKVRPEAKGTNAFQTNRNIKLGPDAWAESVPNLEIENNDVRCSHASAVGPIDPEHRFYLESRGVPPNVAERLLVAGFFEEVIAQMPTTDTGRHVRAAVTDKLDRSVEA